MPLEWEYCPHASKSNCCYCSSAFCCSIYCQSFSSSSSSTQYVLLGISLWPIYICLEFLLMYMLFCQEWLNYYLLFVACWFCVVVVAVLLLFFVVVGFFVFSCNVQIKLNCCCCHLLLLFPSPSCRWGECPWTMSALWWEVWCNIPAMWSHNHVPLLLPSTKEMFKM